VWVRGASDLSTSSLGEVPAIAQPIARASGTRGSDQTAGAERTELVRYQTKPERADENQQLIEAVFVGLNERQPEGFT
jgi:hypothetical protein